MGSDYGNYYDQQMFEDYPDSFAAYLDSSMVGTSGGGANSVHSSSSGGGGGGGGNVHHTMGSNMGYSVQIHPPSVYLHPQYFTTPSPSSLAHSLSPTLPPQQHPHQHPTQSSHFHTMSYLTGAPPPSAHYVPHPQQQNTTSSSKTSKSTSAMLAPATNISASLPSPATATGQYFADSHNSNNSGNNEGLHFPPSSQSSRSGGGGGEIKRQPSHSSAKSFHSNASNISNAPHSISSRHSQISVSTSSSAPPITYTPAQLEMRQVIRSLLENPSLQNTISIYSSRVAQKSYGSEKRFFCPPPLVTFSGEALLEGGEPQLAIGLDEHLLGVDSKPSNIENNQAVFKNLYISDSDKRKHFCLNLKVVTKNDRNLGIFKTKPLKVISKPSKKKQSAKNNYELCITSGTTVSMFNRIRSQTVSTKYLCADGEEEKFVGKTNSWDAFSIRTTNASGNDTGYIHYGMEIVLVSTLSGLSTNPLIIRKVDKSTASLTCTEPVSQLHKVAFYVKGTQQAYFSLVNDEVVPQQATSSVSDANVDIISENAAWTIVGTEKMDYHFYESRGPSPGIMTPLPVVDFLKVQNRSLVEIYGENFRSNLVVWFGDAPANTKYRCEEFLLCEPPHYSEIFNDAPMQYCPKYSVPIFLVRIDDGAVFPTGKSYTYIMEPVPNMRGIGINRFIKPE